MNRILRGISLAVLALPIALPIHAAGVNQTLPARVEQALKANKINSDALSVVMLPLTGDAAPTYVNADVSVNPASTMKLVTTYAALELLGPNPMENRVLFRWSASGRRA